MDVTIVVCTRNREKQLRTCLESIARAIEKQSKSIETVIVDNASTDNTRRVAQEWALASRTPARVIFEHRPGLAVARNTAIRNAQGNLIVFTDDDCRLSQDYLAKLVDYYAQDSGPVVRGGRVELGNPNDLDFSVKRDLQPSRLLDIAQVAGFILGCNMALSRETIARVGQFDERFGAGGLFRSAEDTGKHCRIATRLLRHFFWDSRNAVFELFGGRQFERNLGLTYRWTVIGNVFGLILFCVDSLGFLGRFPTK
jgi:glycosyltransferase involved in cell wall biosynthesis